MAHHEPKEKLAPRQSSEGRKEFDDPVCNVRSAQSSKKSLGALDQIPRFAIEKSKSSKIIAVVRGRAVFTDVVRNLTARTAC